jgi:Fe-S cluster assembly protein SufB
VTTKDAAIYLKGKHARGEVLSIAVASDCQIQDTGPKMGYLADNIWSNIVSKSVSFGAGIASSRKVVNISKNLKDCKNNTVCDAVLTSLTSKTAIFPKNNVVQHKASDK